MTTILNGLSRRRLFGLGAAGLSATALAACSGPSTNGETTDKSSSQDYAGVKPADKIDFWSVHPGASQEVEASIVKAFNSSQSDTTVKLVTAGAGYADIAQKFQTAQASHSLPGVLVLSSGFWFTYYLNKALVNLDELVKVADVDVKDYRATLWADYTYDNKQWMVPYARSTPLFYYNKDHFKKVGLPERAPKTWMEFTEWAMKLKGANLGTKHVFEFGSPTDATSWSFENAVWGWGGNYSKKFDFTMAEAETVAAFEWGRKAIFDDKWAAVASTSAAEDLGAGAISAVVGSTGNLGGILKSAKGKFEVGTGFLPGGPKETDNVCPTGGSALAIPADITPEQQVAAMNFIKFATNPENTVKFSQATGYMPVRESADVAPLIAETPQIKTAIDQLSHTRAEDYARTFVPGGNTIIDDTLIELFTKQNADIAKVMSAADTKMEKVYETQVKPALG